MLWSFWSQVWPSTVTLKDSKKGELDIISDGGWRDLVVPELTMAQWLYCDIWHGPSADCAYLRYDVLYTIHSFFGLTLSVEISLDSGGPVWNRISHTLTLLRSGTRTEMTRQGMADGSTRCSVTSEIEQSWTRMGFPLSKFSNFYWTTLGFWAPILP